MSSSRAKRSARKAPFQVRAGKASDRSRNNIMAALGFSSGDVHSASSRRGEAAVVRQYMNDYVNKNKLELVVAGYERLDNILNLFFESYAGINRSSANCGRLWLGVMKVRALMANAVTHLCDQPKFLTPEFEAMRMEELKDIVRPCCIEVARSVQYLVLFKRHGENWRFLRKAFLKNLSVELQESLTACARLWEEYQIKTYIPSETQKAAFRLHLSEEYKTIGEALLKVQPESHIAKNDKAYATVLDTFISNIQHYKKENNEPSVFEIIREKAPSPKNYAQFKRRNRRKGKKLFESYKGSQRKKNGRRPRGSFNSSPSRGKGDEGLSPMQLFGRSMRRKQRNKRNKRFASQASDKASSTAEVDISVEPSLPAEGSTGFKDMAEENSVSKSIPIEDSDEKPIKNAASTSHSLRSRVDAGASSFLRLVGRGRASVQNDHPRELNRIPKELVNLVKKDFELVRNQINIVEDIAEMYEFEFDQYVPPDDIQELTKSWRNSINLADEFLEEDMMGEWSEIKRKDNKLWGHCQGITDLGPFSLISLKCPNDYLTCTPAAASTEGSQVAGQYSLKDIYTDVPGLEIFRKKKGSYTKLIPYSGGKGGRRALQIPKAARYFCYFFPILRNPRDEEDISLTQSYANNESPLHVICLHGGFGYFNSKFELLEVKGVKMGDDIFFDGPYFVPNENAYVELNKKGVKMSPITLDRLKVKGAKAYGWLGDEENVDAFHADKTKVGSQRAGGRYKGIFFYQYGKRNRLDEWDGEDYSTTHMRNYFQVVDFDELDVRAKRNANTPLLARFKLIAEQCLGQWDEMDYTFADALDDEEDNNKSKCILQ